MLKLLTYLLLLAPLTFGALWLAEHPGHVVIEWQGYEIQMGLGILLGLALLATIIVLVCVLLIRGIFFAPKRLREKAALSRYEKAIYALNHTMTALALGDTKEAERQLNQSRYFLKDDPAVTRLLGVQLAHATGKEGDARAAFELMLEDAATRPVALRGKIRELMREGEWVHARDFAEEAWEGRPSDHWLAMVLLDILFREKDWPAIDAALQRGLRKKSLSRKQASHYRAMMHCLRSQDALSDGHADLAQKYAQQAIKEQPVLLNARLLLVQSIAQQGNLSALLKQLARSWSHQPHPMLSDLFLAHGCDEKPARTLKRSARITRSHPQHIETLLLEARTHMRLAEWSAARKALKLALTQESSARIYELLADLERRENDDDKQANLWLEQAVNAPHAANWHCSHCGKAHAQWHSHCDGCEQFDSISWMMQTDAAALRPPQEISQDVY